MPSYLLMNIAVIGLGYVGVVTSACLAQCGHDIVGVDISPNKVELINQGKSPIVEADIDEWVARSVKAGSLRATLSMADALSDASMAIICVGTPSRADGSLETKYVQAVAREVGEVLRGRPQTPFWFVLRSTVAPGTTRTAVISSLSEGLRQLPSFVGVKVLFHPEFLREGSSVKDFYDPPKIVVGADDPADAEAVLALYEGIEAPRFVTSVETAEAVKYADNCFHALKITFANEIGQFCQARGVDGREAMDIFCADRKLNISERYLKPGFAFGGSCLPKDLRALLAEASRANLRLPMLASVLESNHAQIERVLRLILDYGSRRIGIYGLAFKPGTDDLRESPYVELAERLMGKGKRLAIFDDFVQVNRLVGQNKSFIDSAMPHLAQLLATEVDALLQCELIILSHPAPEELLLLWRKEGISLLDLTGANRLPEDSGYCTVI